MLPDVETLGLLLSSAAVSAFNPCVLGVYILLLSAVLGQGGSTKRLIKVSLAYTVTILFVYLIIGYGFAALLSTLPYAFTHYLGIAIGLIVIAVGMYEIKDYFWYGQGFSIQIPQRYAHRIHKLSVGHHNVRGVIHLATIASLALLTCVGGPYFATIAVLDLDTSSPSITLLFLYNLVRVLPLLIITWIVASGTKMSVVSAWKEETKAAVRLLTGLLLVALGWILLLQANGSINFG